MNNQKIGGQLLQLLPARPLITNINHSDPDRPDLDFNATEDHLAELQKDYFCPVSFF